MFYILNCFKNYFKITLNKLIYKITLMTLPRILKRDNNTNLIMVYINIMLYDDDDDDASIFYVFILCLNIFVFTFFVKKIGQPVKYC